MSAEALNYQLGFNFGSNRNLMVYYDFSKESVFSVQSGSNHQSYLNNVYPSARSGLFCGKIVGASGSSSASAMNLATGSSGFLKSGEGDFTKNYIQISGSDTLPLKDCSYLLSVGPNLSKNGVILGSLEKNVDTVDGKDYISSKGFNFGTNDRGKMFFQSFSKDGDYCFVANSIELSEKNVVGFNFTNSEVKIYRFDYLNGEIQQENFALNSSHINNTNLFLGSSLDYYRNSGQKLYSGKMDEFVLLSGVMSPSYLFDIGKSLFSEYSFSSGSVTEKQVLSGYTSSFSYKTEITGAYANITGYSSVRSGVEAFSQSLIATGGLTVKEGDRFYKTFGDYLENQGYLDSQYQNTYNPTGENASGTLGLQTGSFGVSGYSISKTFNQSTFQVPLYEIVYLTGQTNEISNVVNTPQYNSVFITGADSSGISFSDQITEHQKDYIYYLGKRI